MLNSQREGQSPDHHFEGKYTTAGKCYPSMAAVLAVLASVVCTQLCGLSCVDSVVCGQWCVAGDNKKWLYSHTGDSTGYV